jgi:hypothetical protein
VECNGIREGVERDQRWLIGVRGKGSGEMRMLGMEKQGEGWRGGQKENGEQEDAEEVGKVGE